MHDRVSQRGPEKRQMIGAKVDIFQIILDHTHVDRVLRAMTAVRSFRVDFGALAAMELALVSHLGLSLKFPFKI